MFLSAAGLPEQLSGLSISSLLALSLGEWNRHVHASVWNTLLYYRFVSYFPVVSPALSMKSIFQEREKKVRLFQFALSRSC